jgi:hypothetical protein
MQRASCIYYSAVPSLRCSKITPPGAVRHDLPSKSQVCPLDFKQSVLSWFFPQKALSEVRIVDYFLYILCERRSPSTRTPDLYREPLHPVHRNRNT